jgi:DNA/RNA-binding domain of Phe-tRNA-synthetase-like protein
MSGEVQGPLAQAWVEPGVWGARPDYVAVLVHATGLRPGPTSDASEAMLREAEIWSTDELAGREPQELAAINEWRQAYQGFGVKPRTAKSSVESLMRRAEAGLPRIDRLTDVYNAVSVLHVLPIGGEDLAGYEGPARLVVAQGGEPFDTMADGQPVVDAAEPGEIAWRDDRGITCRRWNWRQCVRTRLSTSTTEALFILDALGSDARLRAETAAADLVRRLSIDSPRAVTSQRTLAEQE